MAMAVGKRDILFLVVIAVSAVAMGSGLWRVAGSVPDKISADAAKSVDLRPTVAAVDQNLRDRWTRCGTAPAARASELTVMRRLSLGLCGTIPSLEEIRRFESSPRGARLKNWLDELLRDRRFADYFAERFARAFVGTEDGPFLVFRRRRFISWLSDAILANRPYRAIVRDLIADQGLWTDHPATNFLTVTFDQEAGRPSPERLGARVARAFLGVRLDCASCHDHPFQHWKQADFRGLAAFFGGVHSDLRGIRDADNDYRPPDRKTKEPAPTAVAPCVPFLKELLPASGNPRDQLADWIVDPRNGYFARETVNRVWALLFGRPLAEPIDDLPAVSELHPALVRLAEDFSAHGADLHHLIRIITTTEVFQLDSATASESSAEAEENWAVFPLTRLRQDQVAGAIFQSGSLRTIGAQSHWFVRLVSYTGRNDFVRRYGDTGEDEFDSRGGTIPQRLLLMNGEVVRERTKDDLFTAASQIADLAPNNEKAIEVAFLAVLTRRPTSEESAHFAKRLTASSGKEHKAQLADLYWSLLNTTEFSWNH
jgi:hypothetical protein